MIQVTLQPHVGIDMSTGKKVTHDQDVVSVDGREVGYLSKGPGRRGVPTLCLFVELSEAEGAVVIERCRTHREGPVHVVNPPPDIPPELLGAEGDDEEDED